MKTQNIKASFYHAKVSSTQNQGAQLFSCLGHGVYSIISSCLGKDKVFPIIQTACQC